MRFLGTNLGCDLYAYKQTTARIRAGYESNDEECEPERRNGYADLTRLFRLYLTPGLKNPVFMSRGSKGNLIRIIFLTRNVYV